MVDYTFPFTTCERAQTGIIAQPVSFLINSITALLVLVMLLKYPARGAVRLVLVSFIVFELWHAYSHMNHLPGSTQAYVIHTLSYLIAGSLMLAFYNMTGTVNGAWIIAAAVVVDVVILLMQTPKTKQWSVISGTLVVFAIIAANNNVLPDYYRMFLVALVLIGIVAFLVENKYCQYAMHVHEFPYHALVEIIVFMFIVSFSYMLVSL